MIVQKEYPPPRQLSKYVKIFWSLDIDDPDGPSKSINVLAHRYPRLLIQCMGGRSGVTDNNDDVIPTNFITGVSSQSVSNKIDNNYSHIAICFFPHAIKTIFGIDADEAMHVGIELSHFCPVDLVHRVIESPTHEIRIKILCNFLLKKIRENANEDRIVADFLVNHYKMTYQEALKNYQISERQFERRFKASVGVSPSVYRRIYRFEHALQLLRSDEYTLLSDIAYDSNYSDQSHFCREFLSFSGFTPKEFATKNRLTDEITTFLSQ